MPDFAFNTTASIRQGWGASGRLGDMVASLPIEGTEQTVLFVTDPGILELGLADAALASLKQAGYTVQIFDQVEPDPKAASVLNAAAQAKAQNAACLIGFGGGSSMDVAKVAALVANSTQPLPDMYGVNQATGTRLPLVLVPTTAGTGSEVTPISILTTDSQEKMGVVSPIILPDIAVLDAALTVGLPPHITAATGVDAMVHAIEAFTSRGANNNPISKALAKQALDLLGANIREAVTNGANRAARENMLLGSMLAGQAFANSPVAAVHALAYPVGSLFHVPHGLSNALVLEAVMRFNAPECSAEYADLAPHVFPDIDQGRDSQAVAAEFIERLGALNVELGLESGLAGVGITADDIPKLAADAMNQTRLLQNNPRALRKEDAAQIYQASL